MDGRQDGENRADNFIGLWILHTSLRSRADLLVLESKEYVNTPTKGQQKCTNNVSRTIGGLYSTSPPHDTHFRPLFGLGLLA